MNYRIRFIASLSLLARECFLLRSSLVVVPKSNVSETKGGGLAFSGSA